MKTKRIIAVTLVAIMIATVGAVFVACDNTLNIKWKNYVMDGVELADTLGLNNKLPSSVRTISIPSDALSVNSEYANRGLLVIRNGSFLYGYLYASGKTLGKDANVTSIYPDDTGYAYIAVATNGAMLFDINGELKDAITTQPTVVSRMVITTSIVYADVDGKATKYLKISSGYNHEGSVQTVSYRPINADGTLGNSVKALPDTEQTLPGVGESISKATTTLQEWLHIDEIYLSNSEATDTSLTTITVQEMGNTVIFYKNGKQTSKFAKPLYLNSVSYADGKLLYNTLTPIDSASTSGYNFVNGSNKYDSKMFSFDIKSGKTQALSVDYVLYDSDTMLLLNNKTNKYDLALVSAYRMVDGIAYKNSECSDTLIINNKGAIGYSLMNNPFGMPICKLGKNFLAVTLGASSAPTLNIIDAKGQLVSALGSATPKAILSDSIVVSVNGKIGTIGFDGIVKTAFEYTPNDIVYGNYAHVTGNDGKEYILDLNSGLAKTPSTMCNTNANNDVQVKGFLIRVKTDEGKYNWYLLNGEMVAENTTNATLTPAVVTHKGKPCGFIEIETANGKKQYLKLEF